MKRTVKEEKLVKALSEMEALAKGVSSGTSGLGNKIPKTTAEANGGLSDEGDKEELAAKSQEVEDDEEAVEKAAKKTLADWAKEESNDTQKAVAEKDEDESDSDEDDESESEDEDESVSKCGPGMKKMAKKSDIADLIKSDTTGGPVIDASPFIETLVDNVSEAERDLRKALIEMHDEQSAYNAGVRKSLVAMGNLVLDVHKKLAALMDAPTGERRSILSKSEVNERFEESQPDFTKSQVLDSMLDLVQKGRINPVEVTRYESTNSMDPATWKVVEGHLTKNA